MKNHEVENQLKNAYSKIETPNVLDSVLSDCKTQTSYVYVEPKKTTYWNKALALACAFVIMIGGMSGFNAMNAKRVNATVAFDVNPSIELEMNKDEEILKVNTLNEDAVKVLDGMDLVGSDLDVAVNALIGSMIKQGYLSELTNSILVSVNSKNQETTDVLQKRLMEEINELIKENNLDGSVLSQRIQLDDEEIDELASVYGITKGKTQLIKEILKTNPYHSFEDLVDLSINELNLIGQQKQETLENVTVSGTASDKKYIGTKKAKEIALENAKLKENQVTELEVELDYEMGTMVYEVEFEYNNKEYDYDIQATDGTILHEKTIKEPVKDNKPVENTQTSYIGKEKAKDIVFQDAQVKESQVKGLWIEMDNDDGQIVYELEFNVGNTEYDYEISAITGKIIDKEIEKKEIDDVDDETEIDEDEEETDEDEEDENEVDEDEEDDAVVNSQSTNISKEEAKSKVFKDANVKVSQISNLEIELEDGVYEISFDVKDTEYSYEISAKTGKILDKEVEED